jgi:hypothetical protein
MAGTTNISLDVLCEQRKKQMLFNNPQSRYTPSNPYNGTFTKYQLDMRRKAEILKYSNTSSSSKTNDLTKTQKLSKLLSGRSQSQGYQNKVITTMDADGNYNTVTVKYPDKLVISSSSQLDTNALKIIGYQGYFTYIIIPDGLIVNCAADNLIPTPTSSSGIYGPITNLIYDETVPLYNFTNTTINNAAYSESEIANTNLWSISSSKNVLMSTNISSYVGSLLINPAIDNNQYTYTLQVPIGIYATNASGQNGTATFTINGLFLDVKYSGNVVPGYKTISLSNYSSNSPIKVSYIELSTSVNGYNYFAYIDTINVSNIVLTTNPGYVYDFYLTVNIDTVNSSYTTGFTNNTIFANYTNSILTSNISLLTVDILPPTNLSLAKSRDISIDVSFSAPLNTTNPIIGYTASANGVGSGVAIASANGITITGLTPSTTYNYLNVTAVYRNGTSSTSTGVVSGTTLGFNPSQYALVTANTTDTSLTVNFINGSNPSILSYYVIAVPDPSSNNQQVTKTSFLNNVIVPSGPITINGLTSGTKYNLQLAQYLTNGRFGLPTNDISGTTLSPPPTGLSISDASYTLFDLLYVVPTGSTPIGYKITSTASVGPQVITDLSNTPYPPNPVRIPGLLTGVTYTIVMTAIYNKVISSFNANSTIITQKTYFSAVTNLVSSSITDVSFYVGYTSAPGTSPNSYTVTITPTNGGTVITKNGITNLSNPYAITGLTSGTSYIVSISSLYTAGTVTSSPLTVTTVGSKTGALFIKNQTINGFDVSFNVPSGNLPQGYYVTATPTTVLNSQTTVVHPTPPTLSSSNLITVPGLISGTTYSVKVTSVYLSGNQDSDPVNGSTLANPPTNLQLVYQTYNTLSISFTAPIGSVPIGYNATATPSTRNGLAVSIFNVSQNPIIISGLSSGTQYSIVISSYYDTGTYDSSPLTASTYSSPSTISGINTNTLTDPSTNAITVYISPPQSGTLPNSYNLIANPKTRRNSQNSVTLSNITPLSSSASYIMTGLISGTVYDVSLVAVYDTGNQTSATTISGTTLANPPTIDSITNTTVNSLTVNYSAPEIGSLPINYTAIATPDSYDNNQSIVTVTNIANNLTTYTIGNLVSATTYDISMISVYDIGNFVSTGSFSGTTTSNPPTSIIITGTTASSIDLSYNPPIGSAPIGYFAIAKPTTTSVGQISVTTIQTTSNQLTIRGLFAGTTYDISMVAVYSVGNQMSTISVSGSTLFSPPIITELNRFSTDASTNAITVYFSPPSGTSPTTYNATAVPDFTNNRQSIVDVTGLSNFITSFVIGNLISGTSYDISMSAVYASGYAGSNVLTGNTLFNAATF